MKSKRDGIGIFLLDIFEGVGRQTTVATVIVEILSTVDQLLLGQVECLVVVN